MKKTIITTVTTSVFPSTPEGEDFRRSECTVACENCGESYEAMTLTLNDHNVWTTSLVELLERFKRTWWRSTDDTEEVHMERLSSLWPEMFPPRHSMSVYFNSFVQYDVDSLVQWDEGRWARESRIWVHLEGVRLYGKSYEHQADNIDSVVGLLQAPTRTRQTAEERIVEWLTGMARDTEGESSAQIHAIADGILEGRHRS